MRALKLTLTRQPNDYTKSAIFPSFYRAPAWRYTEDCMYSLTNGKGGLVADFCAAQFHAATGFTLKPGESQRVEINIKALA